MRSIKDNFYHWVAKSLIVRYPTSWRERYAEEMLGILEEDSPTLKTLFSLFTGVFDAHLHADLVQGRTPHMLQKVRSQGLNIYALAMLFFVPWFFVKGHFLDAVNNKRALFTNDLTDPSFFFNFVPLSLLLILVLGGFPLLLASCYRAWRARDWLSFGLCILSILGPIALVVLAFKFWLFGGFFAPITLTMLFGVTAILISLAVKRVAPSRMITNYALYVSIAIPVVMLIGLFMLTLWISPALFGLIQLGEIAYLSRTILLLSIMLVSFAFALNALKQGFQAKREEQFQTVAE